MPSVIQNRIIQGYLILYWLAGMVGVASVALLGAAFAQDSGPNLWMGFFSQQSSSSQELFGHFGSIEPGVMPTRLTMTTWRSPRFRHFIRSRLPRRHSASITWFATALR
ncbi:hypothetical protein CCP4SC76_4950002 [Gammaproteobacteria bacterium]